MTNPSIMFKAECLDTCFYLTGHQINEIVATGATHVATSISDNYPGHITSVYFLRIEGDSVTETAAIWGYGVSNTVTAYKRKWGIENLNSYRVRSIFNLEEGLDNKYMFK